MCFYSLSLWERVRVRDLARQRTALLSFLPSYREAVPHDKKETISASLFAKLRTFTQALSQRERE
jgi:hypothetical protein